MRFLFALAFVLVAASLGAVTGCGGEERLSHEELSDRLQTIGGRGGELWGRLAQHAQDLKADEALPVDVKEALTELVEFQEQAAVELEGPNPPEGADEPIDMLIKGLRERTAVFEQVIEEGRFTEQHFERVTQAGEEIDQAFKQLRERGFLPLADEHQDE